MDSKEIYCDSNKLREYLVVNGSNFLELDDYKRIPYFWEASSKFACNLNKSSISELVAKFAYYFTLPAKVKDVSEQKIKFFHLD